MGIISKNTATKELGPVSKVVEPSEHPIADARSAAYGCIGRNSTNANAAFLASVVDHRTNVIDHHSA